jgi:chlorobactene glucosyltransferase
VNWVAGLLLAYFAFSFCLNLTYFSRRSRDKRKHIPQGGGERISVLVPVRNEEKNIGVCLDSLLRQSHHDLEIIVMDDHSTDGSREIAHRYAADNPREIHAYSSEPLPEGWSGKNWVCHQLSLLATGSWLLFTDADTIHGRDSVLAAYTEARARGADLVSYLPELITVSLVEKIVIPVIYFAFYLLFPLPLLDRIRDRNAALAIGTFILVNRRAYLAVGGHFALRDEIVEDMHLARLVKGDGRKTALMDGTGLFFTRFYSNARQIWDGFTKNAFGAFGYSILPCIATLAVCGLVFLNPFLQLALDPSFSLASPYFRQVVAIMALRIALAIRTRHSILSVIFHPVMVCFSMAFALNSARKMLMKEPVAWKGREYRITK